MKKLVILIISLLSVGRIWAQGKGPFFPTGTTWTEAWILTGDVKGELPSTTYEVGTDTLINDTIYKRILVNGVESGRWLREEKQRVWLRRDDFPKEIMLYNFEWHNQNYVYYKTNVRQYVEKGVLKEDTFYIDRKSTVYLESNDENLFIEFEYYDFDAVQMLYGIGMTTEPYKDCCILGCMLPDDMEHATRQCQLLSFSRNGKLIYDYKKQFAHCEVFTRNMPPTAGVDVWLYSEWEGFVQGEDLRLDSIRENHIYVSGHYHNKVASDNYKIHLGKFEAGEYQIVYTAVDDSDIMPDVANYIPLTVNEIAVDVPRGLIPLTGAAKEKEFYPTKNYVTDITATIENDSLRISGWLFFNNWGEKYCYYEVHGDSIYLETAEKWWKFMPTTSYGGLYPIDFAIPFNDDQCTIHVAEIYSRSYFNNGYIAFHQLYNTLKYDFTSVNNTLYDSPSQIFYDLQGQPSERTQRGIFIKDGKKILVR